MPIALPLACQGCRELNISMTSQLKRRGQNILVFLVMKQIISMPKFSGIPLNLYEVVFLAIQGVFFFKVYVIRCKLNTQELTEYVKFK